ncbi:MAG: type IV pilin protein [Comamonas sp.]|uniref:type IV pilin protein n=1 Tax=Comamonas sp. TaxID=34028 RepID=UPI003D0C0808
MKINFTFRGQHGFTLIELMIVVAIVAILAAIAMPAYDSYIRKSRRIDAKNAVLDLASRQERYYSTNNKYTESATDLGYSKFPAAVGSGNSFYTLNVSADDKTYTATATPTGTQTKDVSCYSFTINQRGVRGNKSATDAALTATDCW